MSSNYSCTVIQLSGRRRWRFFSTVPFPADVRAFTASPAILMSFAGIVFRPTELPVAMTVSPAVRRTLTTTAVIRGATVSRLAEIRRTTNAKCTLAVCIFLTLAPFAVSKRLTV
jgi:hypothetical protein